MKRYVLFVVSFLIATTSHAQEMNQAQEIVPSHQIEKVQPAGKPIRPFLAIPRNVSREVGGTARDLSTFQDWQWSVLTIGQAGAGIADIKTSLNAINICATCREVGLSRFLVGTYPDAHKYIVAGILEIGFEAVAAHYLLNHGPRQKWYWRVISTLPQSISLYEHARSAYHNAGIEPDCAPNSLRC